jgi:hypothetical protein
MAQIDNPIFSAFAIFDQNSPAFDVYDANSELGDFFHPQTATEHEQEHGSITNAFDDLE